MQAQLALQSLVLALCHLMDQALDLASHYRRRPDHGYETHVGPQLRHVIEHLEQLLGRMDTAHVDYDRRPCDGELGRRPELAMARLHLLRRTLETIPLSALERDLVVQGRTGLTGLLRFAVQSTMGRELAFLAGHTLHHFDLLRAHAERSGWVAPARFGMAPATVAHQLGLPRN